MKNIIISIDAGGTGTRYALIDEQKQLIKEYTGTPGSPAININAEDDIYEMLLSIKEEVKNIYNVKCLVLGMSGFALVNVFDFKKRLTDLFNAPVILENDGVIALYSIIQDKYSSGVVVISGTGSAIFSSNNNKVFMSSGWGQLLTERGSAYASVKDFVCNMIHYREETGTLTPLGMKFLNYFGFKELEDFKMLFYRHTKDEVAKNCIFFQEEAKKGDIEAIEWLKYNGHVLAIDTINAVKRVDINGEFAIGFRGGFINHSEISKQTLISELKEAGLSPIIVDGDDDPVYGGYYLAKQKGYF